MSDHLFSGQLDINSEGVGRRDYSVSILSALLTQAFTGPDGPDVLPR